MRQLWPSAGRAHSLLRFPDFLSGVDTTVATNRNGSEMSTSRPSRFGLPTAPIPKWRLIQYAFPSGLLGLST